MSTPDDEGVTYVGSSEVLPTQPPAAWVDGAPTRAAGQSCAFCGTADVAWVHPLDPDLVTYRVDGAGQTLPAFWALCERCEGLHASGDVDAAVAVMRSTAWSWVADDDVAACLEQPLTVFRRADRGARRLDG